MTLNCTPEQEKAIQQLRNLMKDELPQEVYEDKILLYKFLKARNFNLKKSKAMLTKHLLYRKSIQMDTIIQDFKPTEVQKKYISQTFVGFDKDGCPVRHVAFGNGDYKGSLRASNGHYLLMYVIREFEMDHLTYKQQSKKLGRDIYQTVFIFDMSGFSLAQATHKPSIQHFMKGLVVIQDNYPEMLKKVFIINASDYFTLAFTVIKAVLASATMKKIHVYGQNDWKDELLKIIDADVLPAFLGGKRTDPDGNPLCLTFINHGGLVPESYYKVKDIEKTALKPGMKFLSLERQSSSTIPIKIEKPMSVLHWEFEVKCYDIGFGLTLEVENEENHKELIPVHKLETELEPIYGFFRCKKYGKYNIVFDNSYSWLHHKEIYYRTWVTDDEDSEAAFI